MLADTLPHGRRRESRWERKLRHGRTDAAVLSSKSGVLADAGRQPSPAMRPFQSKGLGSLPTVPGIVTYGAGIVPRFMRIDRRQASPAMAKASGRGGGAIPARGGMRRSVAAPSRRSLKKPLRGPYFPRSKPGGDGFETCQGRDGALAARRQGFEFLGRSIGWLGGSQSNCAADCACVRSHRRVWRGARPAKACASRACASCTRLCG